jgi:hypothetical protein
MLKIIITLSLTLAAFSSFGQVKVIGKTFPEITGETLTDKSVSIPNQTNGKFTLIGMAYSQDAENDLKTWLNPVYNKFIAKTGMMDMDLDVNLYFIPMFTGVNATVAGQAQKKLRNETDKAFHPHIVFYKGELKKYKKELEFDQKDTGYFFVLDKTGKIVYATSGKFSQKKLDAVEDILIE